MSNAPESAPFCAASRQFCCALSEQNSATIRRTHLTHSEATAYKDGEFPGIRSKRLNHDLQKTTAELSPNGALGCNIVDDALFKNET